MKGVKACRPVKGLSITATQFPFSNLIPSKPESGLGKGVFVVLSHDIPVSMLFADRINLLDALPDFLKKELIQSSFSRMRDGWIISLSAVIFLMSYFMSSSDVFTDTSCGYLLINS